MRNFKIISSTDNQFLGHIFQDTSPIFLGDRSFIPDNSPIQISSKIWRFFNSNYSIDAQEA